MDEVKMRLDIQSKSFIAPLLRAHGKHMNRVNESFVNHSIMAAKGVEEEGNGGKMNLSDLDNFEQSFLRSINARVDKLNERLQGAGMSQNYPFVTAFASSRYIEVIREEEETVEATAL